MHLQLNTRNAYVQALIDPIFCCQTFDSVEAAGMRQTLVIGLVPFPESLYCPYKPSEVVSELPASTGLL